MPFLVYLLALAVFAQGTSEFMLGGLLPGISSDLGVPLSSAGLLTSGFALGMVVGAPALAVLGRRLPARATLAGLLAVFVLAHVAGALAPGFGLLLGTRVVAALANAGFLAITMSLLGRIVAPGQHARALAVVLGGTTLALIAGVPLGAFVGEHLGWRATMWGVAAICVPALIAILCAAPARGAEPDSSTLVLRAELAALQQRPLQRSIALAVLANAAVFCSFTYLAVIARQGAGISESLVPLLLVVFGGGAYAGVMVAGRLADRHWAPVITFGIPLACVGWLGFAALVASSPAVWLLSGALGAVSFAVGSTLISRVLANASTAPTLGGAYSTVALNAGAIAGPAAGGLALAPCGAQGPLLVSAACMIMAAIVWWPARASSEPDRPGFSWRRPQSVRQKETHMTEPTGAAETPAPSSSAALPPCPECASEYAYESGPLLACPMCGHEWSPNDTAADGDAGDTADGDPGIRDAVGNVLEDGDTVTLVKSVKVSGGGGGAIKVGTKVTGIRLVPGAADGHDIDARVPGFGKMKLKSSVVKRAN